jgi:hypothetical protein
MDKYPNVETQNSLISHGLRVLYCMIFKITASLNEDQNISYIEMIKNLV